MIKIAHFKLKEPVKKSLFGDQLFDRTFLVFVAIDLDIELYNRSLDRSLNEFTTDLEINLRNILT